jgi:hypothetical protein
MSVRVEGEGQITVRGKGIVDAIADSHASFTIETHSQSTGQELVCEIYGTSPRLPLSVYHL